MKKRILLTLSSAIVILGFMSFENPNNWVKSGSAKQQFDMGSDIPSNKEGIGVITIKSKTNAVTGQGALIKQLAAQTFAGKRVRIKGLIKIEGVTKAAGFWMNTNQATTNHDLSMQSAKRSAFKGNTGNYRMSEVVMDVPTNSTGIAYGTFLDGPGQIYAARLQFDIVDNNTPLTN